MLDFKEAGLEMYWHFWTLVLEKTLKNTMDNEPTKQMDQCSILTQGTHD